MILHAVPSPDRTRAEMPTRPHAIIGRALFALDESLKTESLHRLIPNGGPVPFAVLHDNELEHGRLGIQVVAHHKIQGQIEQTTDLLEVTTTTHHGYPAIRLYISHWQKDADGLFDDPDMIQIARGASGMLYMDVVRFNHRSAPSVTRVMYNDHEVYAHSNAGRLINTLTSALNNTYRHWNQRNFRRDSTAERARTNAWIALEVLEPTQPTLVMADSSFLVAQVPGVYDPYAPHIA